MSYRLYWAHNDGVSGHVWLSDGDMETLAREMAAQGMPWPATLLPAPGDEAHLDSAAVETLLEGAAPAPETIGDDALWLDWLGFLDGATRHGGVLIRA